MKKITLTLFLVLLFLSTQLGFSRSREDYKGLIRQQVGQMVSVAEKDSTIIHSGKLIKVVSNAFMIQDKSGAVVIFHFNHIKYLKVHK